MARKRKTRPIDLKTNRVTHRFELRIGRPLEKEIDDKIQQLKDDNLFASTMREALLLKLTLAGGRVDILYDQHPDIVQRLASGDVIIQPPLPQPPQQSNPDTLKEIEELRKSNEQLRDMLKDLTDLVASMRKKGEYVMSDNAPTQPMKPITGQGSREIKDAGKVAMPVFDDDFDESFVVKKGINSSLAFLNQMTEI